MYSQNKRLVYHFYITPQWRTSEIVKLHFACLKKYSNNFTESIFILSMEDETDYESIKEIETKIIESGFRNVSFKVRKTNWLCESETLQNEIFDKLEKLDGLTFFAHSKGIYNEMTGYKSMDKESILQWITSMYFFTQEYIDEMCGKLYGPHGITYGALKTFRNDLTNKYHWIYSGTFYWINTQRLYDKIKLDNIYVPHCSDRFFSELVFGNILDSEKHTDLQMCDSHFGSFLIDADNYYDHAKDYIKLCTYETHYNDFLKFYKEIIEICEIKLV